MAVWQITMVHLFFMTSFLKCELILFGHLANHQELLFSAFLVFWWVRCTINSARKHEKIIYQSLFSLLKLPNIYCTSNKNHQQQKSQKKVMQQNRTDFLHLIRPLLFFNAPFVINNKHLLPKKTILPSARPEPVMRCFAREHKLFPRVPFYDQLQMLLDEVSNGAC